MSYRFMKPSRHVDRVFIHCSASDNPKHDNVETMHAWHTDPKPRGRGWSDTGYHIFIRKSGQVEEGRPLEKTPASAAGHNRGTIAICCHGLDEDKFTEAQFEELRSICDQINDAYHGEITFHGHREVAAKACPVFDYKAVLNLDDDGYLDKGQGNPKFPVAGRKTSDKMTLDTPLSVGSEGWFVRQLQEELKAKNYHPGSIDGKYGKATRNAVAKMKLENGWDTSDPAMPISLALARQASPHEPIRENMTMKDLRKSGSAQVKNADTAQAITGVVGTASVAYNALPDGPSVAEQAEDVLAKAEKAKGLADRAQDLGGGMIEQVASDPTNILLIIAVMMGAYLILQKIKERRLEEAKELKNL